MDSSLSCKELFLDDIVKLEIYPADQCRFPLPANLTLSEMPGAVFSEHCLTLDLTGEADVQAADVPTLKISTARSMAGLTYTHDLQVSVQFGAPLVSAAIVYLKNADFHVVYTKADGTRWLSYSLWNTSLIDFDDTHATARACQLKVKLSSMSDLIQLK